MPRSTAAPASYYHGTELVYFNFLKMDWPAPVGLLRWTDYPADVYNQNIEGAPQDWDGTHDFVVAQLEQGDQDPLSVSDIEFGNADNSFTRMCNQFTFGCRGVSIECWVGRFEKTPTAVPAGTPLQHQFIGSELAFAGTMQRAEHGRDAVRVAIEAYRSPLTTRFPRRRFSLNFGFKWIPKEGLKLDHWGDATYTLPSRQNPENPAPTGGGGLPLPGAGGPNARPRRGPPPTAGRPPFRPGAPAGGDGPTQPTPRTVNR